MHIYNLHQWQHSHNFQIDSGEGERNTRRVVLLTLIMMVIEIVAGMLLGSMALLADGWHMGTHAVALGITAFAYYYARRHANDPSYSFGTGKVGVLGGFTSAVILAVVAVIMAFSSIKRFMFPVEIHFNEAIVVAFIGLGVNLFSAFLLQQGHAPAREGHVHHDHNLKAAYLHVIADALTSFLAIIALFSGKHLGWVWMDPAMGVLGSVLIARWAYGLLKETSGILLDSAVKQDQVLKIRSAIESDSDNRVTDIHVLPLGSGHFAAIISLVTHYPQQPEYYKDLLKGFHSIQHVTVEVNEATSEPCVETPIHS